jgi:ABC-type uncharacterized transport system substrate-binding protein
MAKVGFLLATTQSDWGNYIGAFKARLAQLNNASVTVKPANGADADPAVIRQAALDLAGSSDVVVTAGTQAALICQQVIPPTGKQFVYASVGDAGVSGLSPQAGGSFTGGSNGQVRYVPQRVTHMLSNPIFLEKFAVVGNDQNEPAKTAMARAVQALAAQGRQVQSASLTPGTSIATFISGLKNQGVKSLYVCSDLWVTVNSTDLNNKAHAAGMKTMWEIGEQKTIHHADDAYGVSFKDMFEKAAEYVDQILLGTKAGDLPLYEPLPTARKKPRTSRTKKSRASRTKKRPAYRTKKKSR